jgi:hypothetical protein
MATWLRDEEAVGSNPATPTQVRAQIQASDWALFMASTALWYSNSVTAQLSAKPLERIAGDRCRDVGVDIHRDRNGAVRGLAQHQRETALVAPRTACWHLR